MCSEPGLQILRYWAYFAKFQMVGIALATLVAVSVYTDLDILGESAQVFIEIRNGVYCFCLQALFSFALINATMMVRPTLKPVV